MAVWVLIGLHGLCLSIAIYQRVHLGLHCHVELFSRGETADGKTGGTHVVKDLLITNWCATFGKMLYRLLRLLFRILCCYCMRRKINGQLENRCATFVSRRCFNCYDPIYQCLVRCCSKKAKKTREFATMTEAHGLYLYPYRQGMQESSLLGGRNSKATASNEPQRLPFMSRDGSTAGSWETTPQVRARVVGEGEKGADPSDGSFRSVYAGAKWDFSLELLRDMWK